MTDPKTFTGPSGYTFEITADGVGVEVKAPGSSRVWIPIADLRAFVSANAMVIYSRAHAPPEPACPTCNGTGAIAGTERYGAVFPDTAEPCPTCRR